MGVVLALGASPGVWIWFGIFRNPPPEAVDRGAVDQEAAVLVNAGGIVDANVLCSDGIQYVVFKDAQGQAVSMSPRMDRVGTAAMRCRTMDVRTWIVPLDPARPVDSEFGSGVCVLD